MFLHVNSMMKKKQRFHCLEIDSSSYDEDNSDYEESSDDSIPDKNVAPQILSNPIQYFPEILELKENNIEETEDLGKESTPKLNPDLFPLPQQSQSSYEEGKEDKSSQKRKLHFLDEEDTVNSIDFDEIHSDQTTASIPDDLIFTNDEEPEPPEVDEVENTQSQPNRKSPIKKKKSLQSLKARNKPMTHDAQLIRNTNTIYDYFNHKFDKYTILKAIHSYCGDFRSAILALSQNPRQFNKVSLFEPPTEKLQKLDDYLK